MTFQALLVEKGADGAVSASIQDLEDSRLPDGDVTVAVEYSTLNYKDGLAITGKGGLVRLWDDLAARKAKRFPVRRLRPFDPGRTRQASRRATRTDQMTLGKLLARGANQ